MASHHRTTPRRRGAGRIEDLRVSDVLTLLAVRRHASVTGAARSLGTTPSSVSKSISRLERHLNARLLDRSSRGVTLTPKATQIMPLLVAAADALTRAKQASGFAHVLTVAAPSFILSAFAPELLREDPELRLRTASMEAPSIFAQIGHNQFDAALTNIEPQLPATWRSEALGSLRFGLFASKRYARELAGLDEARVRLLSFVTPVMFHQGSWTAFTDHCPLPLAERRSAVEVQTIGLALSLVRHTKLVVFGPRIAARDLLEREELAEVPVEGWALEHPLHLCFNIDRVTAPRLALLRRVGQRLAD